MEQREFEKPEKVDKKCADLVVDSVTERINKNLEKDIKI